jgi:DNA recombination protein RmuC
VKRRERPPLSEYCDFDVEKSFEHEDGRLRPDVVIKLPGNRALVVDAKTPLSGYLDAIEAVDDAERERHLALHATQLKAHVQQLGAKAYWDHLSTTPDFVVMFVPGENFFGAAAERAPDLFEFAAAKRVIITTPATLIALAKAVAFGWRQEKVADNARRVHQLGTDLYKRLSTMGGHISGIHSGLTTAVKKYNSFVGSLEATVMPQSPSGKELSHLSRM